MPNKPSSRKATRQAAKRRVHNRAQRSAMRTAIKRVRRVTDNSRPDASTVEAIKSIAPAVQAAQAKLGKAAKVGLIKKNTAARLQSRIAKAVRKAQLRLLSAN
ncbi:MAG: 30S ribosomal protein S20 [Candidatus Sumerlaeia bacterium]|nr:30S ribosomal protein S20 [Candidatus Sumerlaeia bacterium]